MMLYKSPVYDHTIVLQYIRAVEVRESTDDLGEVTEGKFDLILYYTDGSKIKIVDFDDDYEDVKAEYERISSALSELFNSSGLHPYR